MTEGLRKCLAIKTESHYYYCGMSGHQSHFGRADRRRHNPGQPVANFPLYYHAQLRPANQIRHPFVIEFPNRADDSFVGAWHRLVLQTVLELVFPILPFCIFLLQFPALFFHALPKVIFFANAGHFGHHFDGPALGEHHF